MALLANSGRTPLSEQALQQHYASMAQNTQAAGGQPAGGGMSTPPMGLMQMFQGGGSGGAAAGGGQAAGGAAGGQAAGGAAGATGGAAQSGMGAVMSNPFTLMAAAIIGSAAHDNNKGISSWGDTLKGQAGGKKLDYYGGRNDGKTHGFLGKIADKDGATGQSMKGITDFSELDFKNGFKNSLQSVKSLFKGKLF